MAFTIRDPALPLRDSVEMIWDWRVEPGEFQFERILPRPGASLIINLLEDQTRVYGDDAAPRCERLPGAVFSGQFTHSFVIDSHEQIAVMGVVFRPAGAFGLLRERMDPLGNRHTGLEDLTGPSARALRERLLHTPEPAGRLTVLEHWLLARCGRDRPHPAVGFALAALDRSPQIQRIDAIVKASGLSPRRFSTVFREQVGVGAKRYARLQRFRTVVANANRSRHVDWSRVAADCGFHDQPHLVREFRAFSGMTPGAYLARAGHHMNHVPLRTA